jgi:putative inorganic carbon (HCO3(-)) transporter
MRDTALALIVVVLFLAGILVPRIGVMGYVWFSLLRPDILAWSPIERPYSKLLAVGALLGSLRFIPRFVPLVTNPFVRLFVALQFCYLLSVFGAQDKNLAMPSYEMFLQMCLVLGLIPLVIQSLDHLRHLLAVMAMSLGLLGAKFGLYGLAVGGAQYRAGYGGSIGDNNVAALAMACAVPLCWFAKDVVKAKWMKWGLSICTLLTISGVIMFHSRGGILALGIGVLYAIWRSKHRAVATVGLAGMAAIGLFLVRSTLVQRIETIANYTQEASAMERLIYWKAALKMSFDFPFLGVGFGGQNYVAQAGRYLPSGSNQFRHFVHNNYLQVLVDCGYPAFAFYCLLLFGSLIWLSVAARRLRAIEDEGGGKEGIKLASVAYGLQGSLLVFATGSVFLSRVMWDYSYMMYLSVACLWTALGQAQPKNVATVAATSAPTAEDQAVAELPQPVATVSAGTTEGTGQSALRRRLGMKQLLRPR